MIYNAVKSTHTLLVQLAFEALRDQTQKKSSRFNELTEVEDFLVFSERCDEL